MAFDLFTKVRQELETRSKYVWRMVEKDKPFDEGKRKEYIIEVPGLVACKISPADSILERLEQGRKLSGNKIAIQTTLSRNLTEDRYAAHVLLFRTVGRVGVHSAVIKNLSDWHSDLPQPKEVRENFMQEFPRIKRRFNGLDFGLQGAFSSIVSLMKQPTRFKPDFYESFFKMGYYLSEVEKSGEFVWCDYGALSWVR